MDHNPDDSELIIKLKKAYVEFENMPSDEVRSLFAETIQALRERPYPAYAAIVAAMDGGSSADPRN